jgi:hypothetical protein
VNVWEWNHYRILCEGPRIRSWINDVAALDYTEKDPAVPLNGRLGLQLHSGGTYEVQFKDLTIKPLPPTPGVPTWPVAEEAKEATEVLNKASGLLRSQLSRDSSMRSVPQLRFYFDGSVGRGRDLEDLIRRAADSDRDLGLRTDESGEEK